MRRLDYLVRLAHGRASPAGLVAAASGRRFERCRVIVEGSEAVGAWEQDNSLPIDAMASRRNVMMTASAPF